METWRSIFISLAASLAISLPLAALALMLQAAYMIMVEGNYAPQPSPVLALAVFAACFIAVFIIAYSKCRNI